MDLLSSDNLPFSKEKKWYLQKIAVSFFMYLIKFLLKGNVHKLKYFVGTFLNFM